MKKELNSKITAFDRLPGAGKTTNWVENIRNNPTRKFIYITPFLDEVSRIKKELPSFKEPIASKGKGKKQQHFLELIKQGSNIVSTHSLFKELQIDDYSLLNDYVCIMDEVLSVVELIDIKKRDVLMLFNDGIITTDNNIVSILDTDYNQSNGEFYERLQRTKYGNVTFTDRESLVWLFDINIFLSFDKVVILTYQYIDSMLDYYFRLHNTTVTVISGGLEKAVIRTTAKLIDVYEGRYNTIGSKGKHIRTKLSKSWYLKARKANPKALQTISNNTRSFFRTYCKVDSSKALYAVFKDFKEDVKPLKYADSNIAINARATNDYREVTAIAYLANRFMNPMLVHFFQDAGIIVNQDAFALSELLQLLWRGCIRDDKEMKVFIPSKRMRDLLKNWMLGLGVGPSTPISS